MASHNAVAHAWAHQTGRQTRGFNLFYEGPTIYSYGHHFPIARLVTTATEGTAVLFNAAGYSVSTGKHKSIVWRAIAGLYQVFVVEHLSPVDHQANHAGLVQRMTDSLKKAARARTYGDMYLGQAQRLADDANAYNAAFGLALPHVELPPDLGPIKERIARAKAEERERQRKADLAAMDRVRAWVRGEAVWAPHTSLPYVRVRGDKVETSYGATVPLDDALPLFHLAERCAATGRPFTPADVVRVGSFTLDHIDAAGTIRAGCHLIPLERQRLAASRLLPVVVANA